MAEDEILVGTMWMLAHWLLPAKATKEEALELIDKAEAAYKMGLEFRDKDW
jgi:hypothetical protein